MSEFSDMTLQCVECGGVFVHTAGAQEFFKERGFEVPKRCKECREAKKRRHEEQGTGQRAR